MLFNSYIFIFVFLPLTCTLYFLLTKYDNGKHALTFLVIASLFFYGWWNPSYLILIVVSMIINYLLGEAIVRNKKVTNLKRTKIYFISGILFNLFLLGYFKYCNFLVNNVNNLLETNVTMDEIILPLAISFFTFQQIAYIVDTYKGITKEFEFTHYALFVTFFPQLIAGPIVHHKEMLPQFMKLDNMKPQLNNIIIGITIFSLGLFKKVVLADGVAQYSSPVFNSALTGDPLTFFVAWGGALSYTFQLYFDFSGYSDMAIGIARLFGIQLPINFFSPYKSHNIIEFWRRWHITLSQFLRDYVYFSLGGNRKGNFRRYINLFVTMLLGGLWHGAGWTFILWGALHGLYLTINHIWHFIKRKTHLGFLDNMVSWHIFSWLITFISVVNSWVLFRAANLDSAFTILKVMYGFNGIAIPNAIYVRLGDLQKLIDNLGITSYIGGGTQFVFTYLWVIFLLCIVLTMPNSQQIMHISTRYNLNYGNAICNEGLFSKLLSFHYSALWAFIMSIILVISLFGLSRVSEFLYFQF